MKTWSIEDRSGRLCQASSSTRTLRSHGLGASASLLRRRIPSPSCRRFSWMRFIQCAAPICSVQQVSGLALTPIGWRAASCDACVRRFTDGGVSVLDGSQFTCHWSGVTPRRTLFSSVLRVMNTKSPNQSSEPTAVSVGSSAVAVHAASRRWLSFFR